MIRDFTSGDTVVAFVAVRRKEIKEYNGKQYISFEFGDASGRIGGVMWEPDRTALEEINEGDVVKVKGGIGEYRGKSQLRVQLIRPAKEEEYDLSDLLPRSKKSTEDLRKRILELTDLIENEHIRQLARSFWDDAEFFEAYLTATAGKLWHHAYVGGLAEHSLNVTEICMTLGERYEFADNDLLIFGGLFHDMGKVFEYQITTYIDYTDEGRLLRHISLADGKIVERAGKIDGFPPKLLMKLRHLILSHHGNLEFASPVVPQIPEAFILYYADELDSKMGALDRIREKTGGKGWSEYVNLIQRHIYFGEDDE
jgi:3'-5' exoribonuclease